MMLREALGGGGGEVGDVNGAVSERLEIKATIQVRIANNAR